MSHRAMSARLALMYCGRMITRIELRNPYGPDPLQVTVPLHETYGAGALAHDLLVMCLTEATHPVVMSADGDLIEIPRGLLLTVLTSR